ncbi:MAG: glycoside hydrolase family 25 protein [Clostridium sp.]|jgi:GH25 family lysozyme M1 (1,4-beta-N-acetylmuramidase)|nr:glycoside hydrolase family 25 protein [Clostridium sp.]
MDSKLKKLAITASLALILFVALLVLYLDRMGDSAKNTPSGESAGNLSPERTPGGDAVSGQQAYPEGLRQIGDDLTAFLKDESFFDPEGNPILEAAKDLSNSLSLVVTSVEKDLRVQIVDREGQPVEGESFFVRVDGLGEYKDLDQDGIIYIGDLNAGEYFVALLPLEGYKTPPGETRVRVKDKVEYVEIEDISLLIKTEDEVDAQAEDTAVQAAAEDADRTEIKELQKPGGGAKVGIDVSKWNQEIDWDKVKAAGVDFAVIRAGYRGSSTGSLVEDPYFAANVRGAAAAGVSLGIYFFTQAVNEVEAVEEASTVLTLIRDCPVTYPVFIDTEGAGGNGRADGLDAQTRTLVCEAFCRTVENAGYRAGVYASRNWYDSHLETVKLEAYCIWLAEYRSVPLYQGYYQMWQYTSKGSVDGIKGNVDMNISYLGL